MMAKKKNKNKNIPSAPKKEKSGAKKGKISKAREAVREEMRSIIAAAKEKNLIQAAAAKVRKARTFTTEDILSFISDVKVKTTNEVKKVVHRHENTVQTKKEKTKPVSSPEPIKTDASIETQVNSMSYYDRWYSLVSDKGRGEKRIIDNSKTVKKEESVVKDTAKNTNEEIKDNDLNKTLGDAIEAGRRFTSYDKFFDFFKNYSSDIAKALDILIKVNTECAVFALIKLIGDPNTREKLGWRALKDSDIKALKKEASKNSLSNEIYPLLIDVLRTEVCPIKHIGNLKVEHLDFPTFKIVFNEHIQRMAEKGEKKNSIITSRTEYTSWFKSSMGWSFDVKELKPKPKKTIKITPTSQEETKQEEENLYDKYEHGLSDW